MTKQQRNANVQKLYSKIQSASSEEQLDKVCNVIKAQCIGGFITKQQCDELLDKADYRLNWIMHVNDPTPF